MKAVDWSSHAEDKIVILRQYGFMITKGEVEKIISTEPKRYEAKRGRKAIHRILDEVHLLRIIVEEKKDTIVVVTLYPARRSRYENPV